MRFSYCLRSRGRSSCILPDLASGYAAVLTDLQTKRLTRYFQVYDIDDDARGDHRRDRVNRIGSDWLRSLRERLGKDQSNMHSRASAAVRDLCPAARAVGNDACIERGLPDGRKQ